MLLRGAEGVFYMSKCILEINGVQVSFGDRLVLDLDHLSVYDGERIGLIGENGAGKTTLLRVLSGELTPEAGLVRRLSPVAMIRQQGDSDAGDDAETRAQFQAQGAREGLSGGEMTRNRIAGALSARAGLLLADEPTTDLDREGLTLLHRKLAGFAGAVLLVSHDRALLREICDRIWYLEDGKITVFPGGYDDFMAERLQQRERQAFEYDQYKTEIRRLKEAAQRMTEWASSVKKAPSRMGNSEARLHTHEYTNAVLGLSRMFMSAGRRQNAPAGSRVRPAHRQPHRAHRSKRLRQDHSAAYPDGTGRQRCTVPRKHALQPCRPHRLVRPAP